MVEKLSNHIGQIMRMTKRILLVEHETERQNDLIAFLQQQNNEVVVAKNGLIALEKINSGTYDLVIIDINLPYNDAITLYDSIKSRDINVPVVVIAEQNETCKAVTIAYKDFKKKFYDVHRTIVENILRANYKKFDAENNLYRIGDFILDYKYRQLRYKDHSPVRLTPKENKILRLLIIHNNKLVNKKLLQKKVWYNDEKVNYSSINVYISRLRKLLEKDKNVNIINVYKEGFIISDN